MEGDTGCGKWDYRGEKCVKRDFRGDKKVGGGTIGVPKICGPGYFCGNNLCFPYKIGCRRTLHVSSD